MVIPASLPSKWLPCSAFEDARLIAGQDDLAPHSPVLLLFTTSAQTHIFPEIRIDAVRFLDIYLEYIPEVVTEGWMHPGGGSHGRRVMEGYLGILNAGTTFGEVGGRFAFAFVPAPTEGYVRHRTRTSDVYGKRCLVTSSKQLCHESLCVHY